jgi:hypothetical protein
MRPKTCITNLETGEVIIREFNDDEMAERAADLAAKKIESDAKVASEASKQAVLDKLGLTAEEMAALLA